MPRIGLISDVHGNLPALEAVVADLVAQGVATVVNLGDNLSGPLWPAETAEFLMRQSWIGIAGNHDRQLVREDPSTHGLSDRYAFERLSPAHLAWLATLPAGLTLDCGLTACHGIPGDDLEYLLESVEVGRLVLAAPDDVRARLGATTDRVIACGHSHQPRLARVSDRCAIVNPGSVGLPAYDHDRPALHVSETGSPLARYAILDLDAVSVRVTFVAIEYDHHAAARQADANDRPDWAIALRTGYMRGGGSQ